MMINARRNNSLETAQPPLRARLAGRQEQGNSTSISWGTPNESQLGHEPVRMRGQPGRGGIDWDGFTPVWGG